jgi:hypothetical protein
MHMFSSRSSMLHIQYPRGRPMPACFTEDADGRRVIPTMDPHQNPPMPAHETLFNIVKQTSG